jgi:hypothetical protein
LRPSKAILLAAGIALLLFCCFHFFVKETRLKASEDLHDTLSAEEFSLLREGDFVFRLGFGIVSYLLEKQAGASGVSHIGVLIKNGAGFDVVHSISGSLADEDGVQKISFDDFLYEAKKNSFVATRFKNGNGELLAKEARRLLAKRLPFNNAFDIQDTNRLFCSQLANVILQNTHNAEIFSQNAKEFPFSGFFDTSKFEILVDRREGE